MSRLSERLEAAKRKRGVPPFSHTADGLYKTSIDFLKEDGARLLCERIEEAWRRAGCPEIRAEAVLVPAGASDFQLPDGTIKKRGWPEHYTIKIHGLVNGAPARRR